MSSRLTLKAEKMIKRKNWVDSTENQWSTYRSHLAIFLFLW